MRVMGDVSCLLSNTGAKMCGLCKRREQGGWVGLPNPKHCA